MNNLNCQGPLPTSFNSGVVPIPTSVSPNWVNVANLQLSAKQRKVLLRVEVGAAGGLSGFKLTRAAAPGRAHLDWLVNGDFEQGASDFHGTSELGHITTNSITAVGGLLNLQGLAANATAELPLINQEGVAEIGLWVLAPGPTTVEAYGSVTA
jgi:hypothetical protein